MTELENFLLRQGESPENVAAAAITLAESLMQDSALTSVQRSVAASLVEQGQESLADAIRRRDGAAANEVQAATPEVLVEGASDADAAVRKAVANWAESFHSSAPSRIAESTPPAVARALQQATRYRTAEDLIELFKQVRIDPNSAIDCLRSLEESLEKRNRHG